MINRPHPRAVTRPGQRGWGLLALMAIALLGAGLAGAPLGAAAIPTSVQLTLAPNPTVLFAPVVLTVVVSGVTAGPLPPGGTVTVASGSAGGGLGGAGQYPLDALGRAVIHLTIASAGDSTVVASYSGDASYAPGIGFVNAHADFIPTSVAVTSSANPSGFGAPVVFTFETDAQGGKVPDQATGHMEIAEPAGSYRGQANKNGSISVSGLALGTHVFTFMFSGSVQAGFLSSTTTFTQVVLPATTTTLATSSSPLPFGQVLGLTASVAAADGPVAAGTVDFLDGGVVFASAPLAGGVANLTIAQPGIGFHQLSARFAGSELLAGSAAAPVTVAVVGPSTTTITASPAPAPLGAPITFTVTVTGPAADPLAGAVVLSDGALVLANLSLVGGTATFTTSTVLTLGAHTITASYGGGAVTDPSSGALVETVGAGDLGASWSLAGNARTDPATAFLGTTDDAPLVLRTAGLERLRVAPDGNVGIGTAAPSARLTVAGTIASTQGGIRFPDGSVQATAQLTGPAGAPGPRGEVGPAGPPGPPGSSAVHAGSVAVVRAARSHDLVIVDPAVKPGSIILLTFVDGFAHDENAILVTLHEVHAGSFTAHLLATRAFDPGRDRLNYLVIDP